MSKVRVIAVTNQKGGVGKTTTAINLSACLAAEGKRVLAVDADQQGNTTSGLGLDKNDVPLTIYDVFLGEATITEVKQPTCMDGLEVIPANINLTGAEIELIGNDRREYILQEALAEVKDAYDFIIIDCPPSLNMITVNALVAANTVLVPIQCEYFALEGLEQLLHTVNLVKKRLNPELGIEGIVFTMYDARTNLSLQVVEESSVLWGRVFTAQLSPEMCALGNLRAMVCLSISMTRNPRAQRLTHCWQRKSWKRSGIDMAEKKRGLGAKGLGINALINTEVQDLKTAKSNETVTELDLDLIEPNRKQPRKYFDETALEELAASLKAYGMIQPIVVKKNGEYYEIIAGERRWRAAKIAGMEKVPVVLKAWEGSEAFEAALVENLQREDLNPIEEAESYQRLQEEFQLSQEKIAEKVGKSRSAITNSLRLLQLDARVRNFVTENKLTGGHARSLLPVSDGDAQFELAEHIIEEGLSVRAVEALVKAYLAKEDAPEPAEKAEKADETAYRAIEEDLKSLFATKVNLKPIGKRKKGKIEIEYYSEEDLERLLVLLKR